MDNVDTTMPSNEECLKSSSGSPSHRYFSQNWQVSIAPEFPGCMHTLMTNFTFLDFRASEDTISVHEDLIIDPTEFFHTLRTTWKELKNESEEHMTSRDKHLKKLWTVSFGPNYNIEEKMLCGKVLCLIELALNATYAKSMNDKRSYNHK
jgi:hypothetical protein